MDEHGTAQVRTLRRPHSYSLSDDVAAAIDSFHEQQRGRSRSQICEELLLLAIEAKTGSPLRRKPDWVVPAK